MGTQLLLSCIKATNTIEDRNLPLPWRSGPTVAVEMIMLCCVNITILPINNEQGQ